MWAADKSDPQQVLFNACKKALKDKLELVVRDDELFNTLTNIQSQNNTLDRKQKLKLVLEYYKQTPTYNNIGIGEHQDTLQDAVQELELIRNQPVVTNNNISSNNLVATNANPTTTASHSHSPAPSPSNYFNISVPPKPKKYFKTFLVSSHKRNWIDDPLRSQFQYEFPKNTQIHPKVISLQKEQLDNFSNLTVVVIKILNTNGMFMEYHMFPTDTNRLVWKSLDNIQPYPVSITDNIVTLGIYDENDNMIDMGRDNTVRIVEFNHVGDDMYKITLSTPSQSSFTMICNDTVYNFEWNAGDTANMYKCNDNVRMDVVNTPHNILMKNWQFSMICSFSTTL